MRRSLRTAAATLLASLLVSSPALAASAGADPRSNYPVRTVPASCAAPTSAACINASVAILDRARASLGQPPYAVPANFASLPPAQQGFVLANLDRIQYRLPPITGLTAVLSRDAAGGVRSDADPQPTAGNYLAWTANWAGDFPNLPLAYEAWMYDDGPGSGNLDCTSSRAPGCWGHRNDVLYKFDSSGGPLAMGVAQGTDRHGVISFAMLLFGGDLTFHPHYVYTWAQALAAGAGGGAGPTSRAGTTRATVRAAGGSGPGMGSGHPKAHPAAVASLTARYQLRVGAADVLVTRYLRIR